MKSWFLKRSYPEHLLDTEMKKVKIKSREKTGKSELKWGPFVVTYHSPLSGPVVKALDSNPGVPSSKPLNGSKVDSVFHHSEVDRVSTRHLWGVIGKK